MGHPELFSRACDIRRRSAESNINKARLNNSDVTFLPRRIYQGSLNIGFTSMVLSYIFSSMFQLYYYNFSVVCFYSLSVYGKSSNKRPGRL